MTHRFDSATAARRARQGVDLAGTPPPEAAKLDPRSTAAAAEAASEAGTLPTTTELLAGGYARWFGPLSTYVSRYALGRQVRERIVRQILAENLDLLVGRRDEWSEISRLKATANRLIAEVLTGEDAVRRRLCESIDGAEHPQVSLPTTRSRPR